VAPLPLPTLLPKSTPVGRFAYPDGKGSEAVEARHLHRLLTLWLFGCGLARPLK